MPRFHFFMVNLFLYEMFAFPIILFSRIFLCYSKRKKGKPVNLYHEILLILFLLFLVGLASQTVFPQFVEGPDGLEMLESEIQRFNLVPFNKIKEIQIALYYDNFDYIMIEVFGNISMFVVIGFFFPLLWKKFERFTFTVGLSFLISLFIETTQIFLPRATDVDDLIMNTLGGLIGYCIYLAIKKAIPGFVNKCKLEENVMNIIED